MFGWRRLLISSISCMHSLRALTLALTLTLTLTLTTLTNTLILTLYLHELVARALGQPLAQQPLDRDARPTPARLVDIGEM